ncbi:MAG: flippase-like domain-containing protein, partial [Bacteroidales bacterium]|nr:flippase-like domain-containing protein [Bacteroidales bacterium]
MGIGLFFVYWFLLKLDAETRSAIWESFRSANYFWVAVAMLVSVISHVLRALRWNMLLSSMGHGVKLGHSFGAVMIAYLANLAVPRLGEVLRCGMLLNSDKVPVQKSLGTVVTERVVDVLAFGLTILLGLALAFYQLKDWLYDQLITKVSTLPSMGTVILVLAILLVAVVAAYLLFYKKLLKFKFFAKIHNLIVGFFEGLKSIIHLKNPWL